jgi:hypothetical protein
MGSALCGRGDAEVQLGVAAASRARDGDATTAVVCQSKGSSIVMAMSLRVRRFNGRCSLRPMYG